MKIDPNLQYLQNVQSDATENTKNRATQPSDSGAASENSQVDAGDTVHISGTLGLVQQLKSQLAEAPETGSDRVASLRQQVQQGTYNPSNSQIADAMLTEM
jgi:negative regulator of flagellin synthesis FlgM